MSPIVLFLSQITAVSIALIYTAVWYVWPKIKNLSVYSALIPLLLISVARVSALGFVNPELASTAPQAAHVLAYGDFISALLALVAIFFLHSRSSLGLGLAWLYIIFGSLDIAYGFWLILSVNLIAHLGIVALLAFLTLPLLFITSILIWIVLLKNPRA